MLKSETAKWAPEFISMLKRDVSPLLEEAGNDARIVPQFIAPEYFHRGVIGYVFAVSARKRLQQSASRADSSFIAKSGGPWKYSFSDNSHEPFFVYALHADTDVKSLKGHGARSAKKAVLERRNGTPNSWQLSFTFSAREFNDYQLIRSNLGVPLVCLVFDEEFETQDVVVSRLIDARTEGETTPRFMLDDIISLRSGQTVYGEKTDLNFLADEELLDDVDVHLPAARETGTEDE